MGDTNAATGARVGAAGRHPDLDTWNRWPRHLARQLGITNWQLVSDAYEAIKDLNWKLDGRARTRVGAVPPSSIAVAADAHLLITWRAIRITIWILNAQSGTVNDPVRSLDADRRDPLRLFGLTGPPGTVPGAGVGRVVGGDRGAR